MNPPPIGKTATTSIHRIFSSVSLLPNRTEIPPIILRIKSMTPNSRSPIQSRPNPPAIVAASGSAIICICYLSELLLSWHADSCYTTITVYALTDKYKRVQLELLLGDYQMVDVLKKSGVRDAADGVNVGSDFYDALDERVKELIEDAVERADGNGRKTVKSRDV